MACLDFCIAHGVSIGAVIVQEKPSAWLDKVRSLAEMHGLRMYSFVDPNSDESRAILAEEAADVFVLAGYGLILKPGTIELAKRLCINLHGGKLPEFRGSSPMNWALLQGERTHSISILQLDTGVDTGPVLCERTFDIAPDDTIAELHARANKAFPEMLLRTLQSLANGNITAIPQNNDNAVYWPMRFPADGLLLFDTKTADEAHNMVRALTRPYPCAYTYHQGRKVLLVLSRRHDRDFRGEPGRIYRIKNDWLLVSCRDRALWIRAEYADNGGSIHTEVSRYDRLGTLAECAERVLSVRGQTRMDKVCR